MGPVLTYLVGAMAAWVPISEHAYAEAEVVTRARYESIAIDVLDASDERPIFAGRDGGPRTALLLLSLASYESHFAKRTDECKPAAGEGDRDKQGNPTAWTMWQMHDEPNKPHHWLTCTSRAFAARAAREWVRESFRICRGFDTLDRLSFYTDGACKKDWRRSRSRVGRAVEYARVHPIPTADPDPS